MRLLIVAVHRVFKRVHFLITIRKRFVHIVQVWELKLLYQRHY